MSPLKALLSFLGLLISAISALVVLLNAIYQPTKTQFCIALFIFFVPFGLGILSRKWSLILFLAALPLLANLDAMVWTYGSIMVRSPMNAGLELSAGFFLGIFIANLLGKGEFGLLRTRLASFAPPWQFGLLSGVISISAIVGIARNSWQSASHISFSGVLFNLKHFQMIGWHDDFRPLTDWVAYGMVVAVATAVIFVLRSVQNRNQIFFRPLIFGLLLSGLMGIFQSRTGIGIYPGFRVDGLGFPAYGFHPDLHSYAGYIALGAVGLWGYFLAVKNSFEKALIYLVVLISWAGLLLSKSRVSLVLTLLFILVLMCVYFYQKKPFRKYFPWIVFSIFLGVPGLASLVYLALPSGLLLWPAELIGQILALDFSNFQQVSSTLGNRPELYMAALRMIKLLPFMGVGLGDFYHMSSNIQLTGSQLLATINGENTHNYFLQTFAETGLLGVFAFIVLMASPLWGARSKKLIIPAGIAFASLLLGNAYAHAFLVRENLLLASAILALLYVEAADDSVSANSAVHWRSKLKPVAMFFAAGVLLLGSFREVYQSLNRFPYEYGSLCFVSKDLSGDYWTSGIYEFELPANVKSVILPLALNRSELDNYPLKLELQLIDLNGQILAAQNSTVQEKRDLSMRLDIPRGLLRDSPATKVRLKLSSCFTPRNLGLSTDGRRLGVQAYAPEYIY